MNVYQTELHRVTLSFVTPYVQSAYPGGLCEVVEQAKNKNLTLLVHVLALIFLVWFFLLYVSQWNQTIFFSSFHYRIVLHIISHSNWVFNTEFNIMVSGSEKQ